MSAYGRLWPVIANQLGLNSDALNRMMHGVNATMADINATADGIDDSGGALEGQRDDIKDELDGLKEKSPDDTPHDDGIDAMRDGLGSDLNALEADVTASDFYADTGYTVDDDLVSMFGVPACASRIFKAMLMHAQVPDLRTHVA